SRHQVKKGEYGSDGIFQGLPSPSQSVPLFPSVPYFLFTLLTRQHKPSALRSSYCHVNNILFDSLACPSPIQSAPNQSDSLQSIDSQTTRSFRDASFALDSPSSVANFHSDFVDQSVRRRSAETDSAAPANGRGLRQGRQGVDNSARIHQPRGRPS